MKDYELKKKGGFITGVPVCDWSTQTSWDSRLNERVMAWFGASLDQLDAREFERDRWQNYKGLWFDPQTFVGSADNIDTKNKRKKLPQRVSHCNVLSGRNAHERREWLGSEKTTRIDCQLTIPTELQNLRRIGTYLDLMGSRWGLIHDGYSPATLTLNQRTNPFYARIYIKTNEKGEFFIRYETEYKQDKAIQLANSIGEFGYYKAMSYGVNDTLLKQWKIPASASLQDGDEDIIEEWNANLDYARFLCEGSGVVMEKVEKEKPTIIDTYHWYMSNVVPAMERIASSEELPLDMRNKFISTLRDTYEIAVG